MATSSLEPTLCIQLTLHLSQSLGDVSSFVDGRLSISYPNTASTSRFFPIGKGSIYRPVTLQQTATSSSPVVTIEMINTTPTGSYASTLEGISATRYYAVSLLSGTMNSPIVELNFNTNSPTDESVSVAGNVHVARSTSASGPWTDEGGSGVISQLHLLVMSIHK
ncbi:MAG: hypothetical protein QM734_13590 [Cyclobacteriaceae bacterium]